MDPIGLSRKIFDGVGQWRTRDSGIPIDSSSRMFDGSKLDGPVSLRQAIVSHSDVFAGTFTENLLAYALGRVIDSKDMPAVRSVEREAARNDGRFSAYVLAIVQSTPFQMRRAEPVEPAPSSAPPTQPVRR